MAPVKTTNFDLYDIIVFGDESERANVNEVELEGWVRTNRDNGSIGFVEFNDGTYFKNVQLVYLKECKDHEVLASLKTGSAIKVTGRVKLTPENKQPFEIKLIAAHLKVMLMKTILFKRRDIASNSLEKLLTYVLEQTPSKQYLE